MSSTAESCVEQFQEACYLDHVGDQRAAEALFIKCVERDPGDVDFVDGLLQFLARRGPPVGSPAGSELPVELANAVGRGDWAVVRRAAPRQLAQDPGNVRLLDALAEASEQLGELDVALRYLRAALEVAPHDVGILRRAGRIWGRQRAYGRALECWKQVENLAPDDREAGPLIARLAIADARQRGGLTGDDPAIVETESGAPNPAQRPVKPRWLLRADELRRARPTSLPPDVNDPRTPIQRLEAELRDHPIDVVLYLQLAPMYLEQGRDYDAERLLAKGRAETEDEPRIRELWEDVTMQRLAKKIQQAHLRMQVDNTDEARADYTELCAQRDRLETEFFVERRKRNPDDPALAFELGRRLRQAGQIRDAMRCFEQASQHATYRAAAACELAECALQVRELSAAFRYCRQAIDAAHRPMDRPVRVRALLRAAELAARLKMPALARSYLDPLLSLEPHHPEAAALRRSLA